MSNALESSSTTVAAGEAGLGSYLDFGRKMVTACEQGSNITETTLADMYQHDWSGPRTVHYARGKELLDQARAEFAEGVTALEGSLAVTDAYGANPGTGDKNSVTNI